MYKELSSQTLPTRPYPIELRQRDSFMHDSTNPDEVVSATSEQETDEEGVLVSAIRSRLRPKGSQFSSKGTRLALEDDTSMNLSDLDDSNHTNTSTPRNAVSNDS